MFLRSEGQETLFLDSGNSWKSEGHCLILLNDTDTRSRNSSYCCPQTTGLPHMVTRKLMIIQL